MLRRLWKGQALHLLWHMLLHGYCGRALAGDPLILCVEVITLRTPEDSQHAVEMKLFSYHQRGKECQSLMQIHLTGVMYFERKDMRSMEIVPELSSICNVPVLLRMQRPCVCTVFLCTPLSQKSISNCLNFSLL